MSWLVWSVAAAAAAAAALALPGPIRRWPDAPPPRRAEPERDLLARGRMVWVALAFLAGLAFAPGRLGLPAGAAAAAAIWWVVRRAEPASVRRRREAAGRDLPFLVDLYAAALAAGAAPGPALGQVCAAFPGPATDELQSVRAGLALGRSAGEAWRELSAHPTLGPLGRTMLRAQESGAPVVEAVRRLADDLNAAARRDAEDRARAVGVRAAVPLGLCLLPAFLLLGIVPLVVGAVTALRW